MSSVEETKLLFVCTANVCRSPMAEVILNALAGDRGVPCIAESAGVAALVGEGISPRAVAALEELGVYPGDHRARQVDARMLEEADRVLAMTRDHADVLRRRYPGACAKVRTLAAFAKGSEQDADISDPYGQSMAVHRASARQLLHHLYGVMDRVEAASGASE